MAAEGCESKGAIRFDVKGKAREKDVSHDDAQVAAAAGGAVGPVSTGDSHLDRMLRGGLTTGMLTELVGER